MADLTLDKLGTDPERFPPGVNLPEGASSPRTEPPEKAGVPKGSGEIIPPREGPLVAGWW